MGTSSLESCFLRGRHKQGRALAINSKHESSRRGSPRPEIEQAAPVTDPLFTLQNSFSFSEIVDKERRAGQLENKIPVNLELLCKFSL